MTLLGAFRVKEGLGGWLSVRGWVGQLAPDFQAV